MPLLAALALAACALPPLLHEHGHGSQERGERFVTSRASPVVLPLPGEEEAYFFVVFGDRTGGPAEGIRVLERAVDEVNLLAPDLVMTVGDLVQGYNETPEWLAQMREFRGVMDRLESPWFPVAGNHDVYWRGKGERPSGEHEANYEEHFGPLWYAFRHKSAWFIALYSDEGDPRTGRKSFDEPASQRMGDAQLRWLESTLDRTRQAEHAFVFLHHPRWLGGGYGDDWERVHALLAKAGNVRAVFAGHIHRMRYDGARDGIEHFALATVGGVQEGHAPAAGYLHQYHVVVVRPSGISVAAYPVGSAMDPRAVTGEVSEEVERLAAALAPRWSGTAALAADGAFDGELELRLANPTSRPVEVTLVPRSADSRWRFAPDHQHAVLRPGAERTFALRAARPAGGLDSTFRAPELALQVEYLAEGLRVPLPERAWRLPLDCGLLPAPPEPAQELALALDGVDDCALVESARVPLPDGPFTLEGWLRASDLRGRRGFLCKTENSEYGLFVSDARPDFSVHLDGRYATARAREPLLETGRWHHLAGVFDGAEVRLYVDGRLAASVPGSGERTRNDLPLVLGADVGRAGGPVSFVAGSIDEVRLSTGARYSGEAFEPRRRFEPDGDTLLLVHADGQVGPWIHDASGAGRHPVLAGDPRLTPAGP